VANGIGIKITKTEIDQTAGDSILEQLPRVTFCEAKRIPQDSVLSMARPQDAREPLQIGIRRKATRGFCR